jgi:hypothetical protein
MARLWRLPFLPHLAIKTGFYLLIVFGRSCYRSRIRLGARYLPPRRECGRPQDRLARVSDSAVEQLRRFSMFLENLARTTTASG